MVPETHKINTALKQLHTLQSKQSESVRRIADLRQELEKRSRKIQKKEIKMARLEQQVHKVLDSANQPTNGRIKNLRPARLIINANSGSFTELVGSPEKLVAILKSHGIQPEVFIKTSSKAVRKWAREAAENNQELVIAVGGDGTIEDVAFELIGSQTVLGIIPTGSMNNLARALGIPLDIEQACALVGTGITRHIDAGCIRAGNNNKCTYFLETAGLGLSIALPAGQNIKKRRFRKLPEQFRKMFDQEATPTQIELDTGEKVVTKVKLVTVSNAPLFAINNMIAPDARMDDGLFDVAVYDGMNDLELANYFLSNAKAKRVFNPNVRFYRTRHVHIRSSREKPHTADKDELPPKDELYIEVIPHAISVIAGQGVGLAWPVEAVQSVPPLTGEQTPSKKEAASEMHSDNGTGNDAERETLQQFESSLNNKN